MKWMLLPVLSILLIGCATTKHQKSRHRHKYTVQKVYIADDAATRALIKSLRDE